MPADALPDLLTLALISATLISMTISTVRGHGFTETIFRALTATCMTVVMVLMIVR